MDNIKICKCGYEIPYKYEELQTNYIEYSTIMDVADGYDKYVVMKYVYCPKCARFVSIDTFTAKIGHLQDPEDVIGQ